MRFGALLFTKLGIISIINKPNLLKSLIFIVAKMPCNFHFCHLFIKLKNNLKNSIKKINKMRPKISLFSNKELYLIDHHPNGRHNKWDKIPLRNKRKQIYDNMHLVKGMEFTPLGNPILRPYIGNTDFISIPYTQRNKYDGEGKALHFFLDDYQFRDKVWTNLEHTTYSIRSYDYIFTPDLSLWKDYPTDFYNKQNIFRTRFVGAYWQLNGYNVIPTASWGDLNSFQYCFDGLPANSIIAISGMGNRKTDNAYNLWCHGLRCLEEAKKPILFLIYGHEIEVEGISTPMKFIPDFISTKLRKLK